MEAIWVAAEMRAGGAWAHSTLALAELGVGTEKGHASEALVYGSAPTTKPHRGRGQAGLTLLATGG